MSENWKSSVARRPLLAALGALGGIVLVGGAAYEATKLAGGGASQGPYADLLAGLGERRNAVVVGQAGMAGEPGFRPAKTAESLRQRLAQMPLSDALAQDAMQNRIVETQGWVLPETLACLCALAASVP